MFDGNLWRPRPGFEIASFLESEHKASVANHWTFLQPFQNAFLYALQRDPRSRKYHIQHIAAVSYDRSIDRLKVSELKESLTQEAAIVIINMLVKQCNRGHQTPSPVQCCPRVSQFEYTLRR